MLAEIIPLHRVKVVCTRAPHGRFGAVEKSPPKARELRAGRPAARVASIQCDVLCGLQKLPHRARRARKLRLFRVFKLFGDLKAAAPEVPYRAVGERLRRMRRMRRL